MSDQLTAEQRAAFDAAQMSLPKMSAMANTGHYLEVALPALFIAGWNARAAQQDVQGAKLSEGRRQALLNIQYVDTRRNLTLVNQEQNELIAFVESLLSAAVAAQRERDAGICENADNLHEAAELIRTQTPDPTGGGNG